jgi:hypothetical protein
MMASMLFKQVQPAPIIKPISFEIFAGSAYFVEQQCLSLREQK